MRRTNWLYGTFFRFHTIRRQLRRRKSVKEVKKERNASAVTPAKPWRRTDGKGESVALSVRMFVMTLVMGQRCSRMDC